MFYSNSTDTTFRLQHGNKNKILRLQKIRKFWPHPDNKHNISVKSEDCFWTVYLLTFGSHETAD